MNARKNMIIIKGEIQTSNVRFCQYNPITHKMDVEFNSGKKYSYSFQNVEWLTDPVVLNPNQYRISREGREFFDIEAIYVFKSSYTIYWHICFGDGSERDYKQNEIQFVESCLANTQSENVFEYLKQLSGLSDIKNKDTDEKMLVKKYEKISFVGNDTALAKYLNPSIKQRNPVKADYVPIFPFGCNNSQYKAVKNAMENQISVIQGPPGTGKTQTILNIIANILMEGKTVQVVSNNNAATENVYEKLNSEKYDLGFIVATLGKSDNKKAFVNNQNVCYPDFSSWKIEENPVDVKKSIRDKSSLLRKVYDMQERLAKLKQEQTQLTIEYEYFKQYVEETDVDIDRIKLKKELFSYQWMNLWQQSQMISETKQKIGFLFVLTGFLKYGITNLDFYKQDITKIITTFQSKYYLSRQKEIEKGILDCERFIADNDSGLQESLCEQSMLVLKDGLARRYQDRCQRIRFTEEDLWKNSQEVLMEYPVILSTTFSSRNSLNSDVIYDYLIMDEASQVDVATGALALSCAKNVVIVGDTKQLPNVVTEDIKTRADAIFDSFKVKEGYRYTKSFLQSILEVIPNVTQTLLREHYRCHPKIINFCNQKFYHGELIIMTEDKGEDDVLKVIKTVEGNHSRNHYSQRQIDVIREEVLPKNTLDTDKIGIISPYKNQVQALKKEFKDITSDTVHKFQGKEKDMIIISTVDDEISDFADDPYLINVAVSRAKKKLVVVTTGNEQVQERNITDLISYIQYNNFEVVESNVYSVFDYLYKQYTDARKLYLQKNKKISEYASENLMNALLDDILSDDRFASINVVSHFPINMLIKDLKLLNERECRYAMHPSTHIDFLLYNRISKKPVLAIEVDGYNYHQQGTKQATRDELKNHILELYEIPLLRFWTNGSGEREKIVRKLEELVRG